jgi:predicted secreted protein
MSTHVLFAVGIGLAIAGALQAAEAQSAPAGEGQVLYNGIRLPSAWPPRIEKLTREPMPVPYLDRPPAVIPIDVGRQLFVDDFLIESTTLTRAFHLAQYHEGNPVLHPGMPFSDGVWWDPKDGIVKMWYSRRGTSYATSPDGIHWTLPVLDVKPGTNVVQTGVRDSNTVWLDLEEKNPKRRFKMFRVVIEEKVVDGKKVMEVKAGEEFAVSVYANPSTGYAWQLADPLDAQFLQLLGSEYLTEDTALVGAGCEQEWRFKALKPGSTKISLKYLRSWEKDIPPVKIEEFEINVR